jgi:hypothetical protein
MSGSFNILPALKEGLRNFQVLLGAEDVDGSSPVEEISSTLLFIGIENCHGLHAYSPIRPATRGGI